MFYVFVVAKVLIITAITINKERPKVFVLGNNFRKIFLKFSIGNITILRLIQEEPITPVLRIMTDKVNVSEGKTNIA